MSPLHLLVIVAAVSAMPHSSHEDHHDDEHDDDDLERIIIVQCLAENGDKEGDLVKQCLQCFGKVDDIEEKKGLDQAKACVTQFLPQTQKACSTQLSSLTAGNDDEGEDVLDCFQDTFRKMQGKKCLDSSSSNNNIVDSFTEAALCMLEVMHNSTRFVKAVKLMEEGGGKVQHHGQHGHGRRGKEMHQIKKSMKLVPAHCHQSIGQDQKKLMVCEECFHSAFHSGQGQVWTQLADCNTNHLSPQYDACTDVINGVKVGKKNEVDLVKDCYMRALTRGLVEDCSSGQELTTSLEDFLAVFHCGHQKVEKYIDEGHEDDN